MKPSYKFSTVVILIIFVLLAGCLTAPMAPVQGPRGLRGADGSGNMTANMTAGPQGINGTPGLPGIATDLTPYYLNDTSKALWGMNVRRNVNNDVLQIIGGTGVTPYSGTLQLYGGDNVAMNGGWILSVGNAAGNAYEVVASALGRTDTPILNLHDNRIASLQDPVNAQDAVTKNYLGVALGNGTAVNTSYVELTNLSFVNITPSIQWTAWTPGLNWTTGTPAGITTIARYTQIGKTVHYTIDISSADSNGCSNLNITLPIPPANNANRIAATSIERYGGT